MGRGEQIDNTVSRVKHTYQIRAKQNQTITLRLFHGQPLPLLLLPLPPSAPSAPRPFAPFPPDPPLARFPATISELEPTRRWETA